MGRHVQVQERREVRSFPKLNTLQGAPLTEKTKKKEKTFEVDYRLILSKTVMGNVFFGLI